MKILIGQVSHETSTFSSIVTDEEKFRESEWESYETVIMNHRNVSDYLGGMIDKAEELDLEVFPSFSALASPSGVVKKETYITIKNKLISSITEATDIDAICLALHGAGVVEEIDDLEGDLLFSLRQKVGTEMPIVATLDLHANMTEKMVQNADILLSVNYYPHIDSYDKGSEAIQLTYEMVHQQIKPAMYLEKLPLIIPTSTTNYDPAKSINERCWELEKQNKVLDCSFLHGFPYSDIYDAGASVLCITNDDLPLAQQLACEIGEHVWEQKNSFFPFLPEPTEGIKTALNHRGSPIVINETSDNPGAGAPGDGTNLLKALLEANVANTCFGIIHDPAVVQQAIQLGVGNTIEAEIGGKADNYHGKPVKIKGHIQSITDGNFIQSSPMWKGKKMSIGISVRLDVNGINIIISSIRNQVFDEQIFLLHGINVKERKIVALKSSHHFRAAFEKIAKAIITVDSPGLSTNNFQQFQYEKLNKETMPFNKKVHYIPSISSNIQR